MSSKPSPLLPLGTDVFNLLLNHTGLLIQALQVARPLRPAGHDMSLKDVCNLLQAMPLRLREEEVDDDQELSQQRNVYSVVFPTDGIHGDGSHQTIEHVGEGVADVCDCHSLLTVLEGEDFNGVACESISVRGGGKSETSLGLLKVNGVIAIA